MTGQPPGIAVSCWSLLNSFEDFLVPFPKSLMPQEFSHSSLLDVEDLMVAADFYDERGMSRKAATLRAHIDCHDYCEDLLANAIDDWCMGCSEQPPTAEVLSEITDEYWSIGRLKRPYGFARSQNR